MQKIRICIGLTFHSKNVVTRLLIYSVIQYYIDTEVSVVHGMLYERASERGRSKKQDRRSLRAWAAQPGSVGDNVPPLLGPAWFRGYSVGVVQ